MPFDAAAATARYIDSLGAEALERARDYTVGSHWLLLWGLVVSAVVTWLIVRSGVLERIGARGTRSRYIFLAALACMLLSSLLSLPWTLYADWWRETHYGRSSQPLGDYLLQSTLDALIFGFLGALFFLGVYGLIHRAGRRWWLWSGAFTGFAFCSVLLVAPVVIEPLFNDYTPLPAGPVHGALDALAREAGIPPERIFVFDGSRQSNNFTANVSGIGASARIAISDVALRGTPLDEVRAVTAHEIGHYVSGHVYRIAGAISLLAMLCFFLGDRVFARCARLFGSRAAVGDPAGLPVLLFLVSVFSVAAEPVMNALVRDGEMAADRYSLEHVGLPDAFSTALLKTAEYRDPRPGALRELLFYSHPSVERRIRMAMAWKAAHPQAQAPDSTPSLP